MDKAFLEDMRNEVLVSSFVLGLWGVMLILPNSFLHSLPAVNFLSGLFANFLGYMGMVTFSSPMAHYLVGLILISVAVSPFVFRERGIQLSFLTAISLAVYGIMTLLYLIVEPTPLFRSQVIGMGAQITVMGGLATVLYRKVLKHESFSVRYDRGLYAAAFIQVFTGLGALTLVSYLQTSLQVSLVYPLGGVLIGALLIYSAVELLHRTTEGIWISMGTLTFLVLLSVLMFNSRFAAVVFLAAEVVIWEKKEFFEEFEAPVEQLRNNLDNWG